MENNKVTVTDIDIPFGRVVGIILKWVLASIPAMILVGLIIAIGSALLGGIFAGIGSLFF
jgi:hypothetical protein